MTTRRLPVGPQFAILPGRGLSTIRFGATVETIERQMGAKCDERTPILCRYVDRAVEFELKDGALVGILVHRQERPVLGMPLNAPRTYGVFHGYIPPEPEYGRQLNVMFGMHVPGVEEALGKATKVEQAPAGNPYSTVEIRHYPGLILEFDRVPESSVPVLGGIRVVKTNG